MCTKNGTGSVSNKYWRLKTHCIIYCLIKATIKLGKVCQTTTLLNATHCSFIRTQYDDTLRRKLIKMIQQKSIFLKRKFHVNKKFHTLSTYFQENHPLYTYTMNHVAPCLRSYSTINHRFIWCHSFLGVFQDCSICRQLVEI